MKTNFIHSEKGFSLIELLVAVAILSLVAFTLLESQAGAIRNTGIIQERALATIVAENQLARLISGSVLPEIGVRSGEETQLGALYRWQENVRLAPGGDLLALEVKVKRGIGDDDLVKLVGFRRVR